jgi:hypothetical protein
VLIRSIIAIAILFLFCGKISIHPVMAKDKDEPCNGYKASVIKPSPSVNYKLRIVKPDNDIDHKVTIINPCQTKTAQNNPLPSNIPNQEQNGLTAPTPLQSQSAPENVIKHLRHNSNIRKP